MNGIMQSEKTLQRIKFDALIYGTIHHGAEHTKVKRATSPTARFFHVPNLSFRGWECLSVRTAAQLVLRVYTQPHLMA